MHPSRRGFLAGSAFALSMAGGTLRVQAASTDSRFVLVFLRGGMDGLNVVVPYGDPSLATWRAPLVPPQPGQAGGLGDLGGFWGLHPALPAMLALYKANELLPVQCVAGPDRSRSHFEAQDVMESGADRRLTSGWLNRIAGLLPASPRCDNAFSVGFNPPLVLQGPAPAECWFPFHRRPHVSAGFYENIVAMHARDRLTGEEMADALKCRGFIDEVMEGVNYQGLSPGFPQLARAAARLLSAPDGPRMAELDLDGWDTHAAQEGRLTDALRKLDEGMAVLRAGMGPAWSRTVVLVLTEFGRTVRVNGTHGTDHGTGTVAFLAGGAVAGGRVLADWPGLRQGQLFEDRDLQPTLDIRAVAKGVVGPLMGLSAAQLETVFPDSAGIGARAGLLRV